MAPRLQDRLLLRSTNSIDELKGVCQKYERMWASLSEQAKERGFTERLAELGFGEPAENSPSECFNPQTIGWTDHSETDLQLAAINRTGGGRPNSDLMICWNCDDIGHSFTDCQSAVRKIFCYGCGCKNVYKPTCQKCNPKNPVRNGAEPRRPGPNPFSVMNPQVRQ